MATFDTDLDEWVPEAAALVDGHVLTIPLEGDALHAIRAWEATKTAELTEVLAPYGIHPYDLAQPEWARVVLTRHLTD